VLEKKTLGLIGCAMAVAMLAQPSFAQERPNERSESRRASGVISGERVLPGRIGGDRNDRERERTTGVRGVRRGDRSEPAAAAAAPSAEQVVTAGQALATAAGKTCQATEAVMLGRDAQQQGIYEVACANAPGYIIVGSTPPMAVDCLELAGTAATARARNPAADVGQQCALPANDNGLAIIGGWARDAGVSCTVDQAVAIGKSSDDNMIYEVGCSGQDGYWLEKTASGWDLQDCLQVVAANGACKFTTADEQVSSFRGKLTGTDAASCDIQAVRLMGQNTNGRFYEAKCGAGDGYIARVNAEGVTQQVYACTTAQARAIGTGCTLTTVAPAATTEQ
jgi:hypothetical protein